MRPRRLALLGMLALSPTGLLLVRNGSGEGSPPAAGGAATRTVLVLDAPLGAGRSLQLERIEKVVVPVDAAPAEALVTPDQATFRVAAVDIPAGLPLVASLFRRRSDIALGAGDRAVGVRVDDVSGLPALIDAGSLVDVVIGPGGPGRARTIPRAVVLARPRRGADGVAWSVVLRLPAALAEVVGRAQSSGADVRLLARGAG